MQNRNRVNELVFTDFLYLATIELLTSSSYIDLILAGYPFPLPAYHFILTAALTATSPPPPQPSSCPLPASPNTYPAPLPLSLPLLLSFAIPTFFSCSRHSPCHPLSVIALSLPRTLYPNSNLYATSYASPPVPSSSLNLPAPPLPLTPDPTSDPDCYH